MAKKLEFLSYTIHIWRVDTSDTYKTDTCWHIEAENLQTHHRWTVEPVTEGTMREQHEWMDAGMMSVASQRSGAYPGL
jgi:hypothetical protein